MTLRPKRTAWILGVAALNALPARAVSPPTAEEQYVLELINRARLDPAHEVYRFGALTWGDNPAQVPGTLYPQPQAPDLNEGLPAGTISTAAKQPLAFNTSLTQAARDYSTLLLQDNKFQHEYQKTTQQQMTDAGYVFSGGWSYGQNLAVTASSAVSFPVNQVNAGQHHQNLFIDSNTTGRGHRTNLLSPAWKEVGIGFAAKSGYTLFGSPLQAILSTYDYAYSGGSSSGNPFITGVVRSDATTDNNFYDVGEGLTGVTVSVTNAASGAAVASTVSVGSGGFTVAVPPNVTYNVTISGGSLPAPIIYHNVVVGTTNEKLDATSDMGVWNSSVAGIWSVAGNWSGTAPNAVGASVVFGGKNTGPVTATVDAARTAGTILFRSAQAYTVDASAANKITLDIVSGPVRIDDNLGSHTISSPIQINDPLEVSVIAAADVLTISGAITQSAAGKGISKFGKGLVVLGGANTFSGGVSEGRYRNDWCCRCSGAVIEEPPEFAAIAQAAGE